MSESLFSTYWYRVANLKPVLRDSVEISRHVYRAKVWHVLRNSLNGRILRFNATSFALIAQMDGQLTMQQIWDNLCSKDDEAVPTQDEVIRLLARLHDADLIQSDILPSTLALFQQNEGQSSDNWKQRLSNPFSLRFGLFDPDWLLEKWRFPNAHLFTRTAFSIWLLVVFSAMVAAALHWSELSGKLNDQLFLTKNLVVLWLTFPLIKVFHELGHALAVKKWGGEVHEMGILLLALTPIPYVDATASAAFPEKRHRMIVAAMGMMVELLLAAVALFVWLNVETGILSALAYNVMLIGGVSTILFNGNPLMRYDGYYMLADLIEIPNLAQRSTRYLGYLLQRYLFGIESAESPVTDAGERKWFLVYGPVSFCYRIVVVAGLVWLVSSRFFVIGVLIALWGVFSLLIFPAVRHLYRFLDSPAARNRRLRILMIGSGAALAAVLLLFVFPAPFWTSTQGVIWLPEQSAIRAGTDFEVVEVLAPIEQIVTESTPLVRGSDPFLEAELKLYRARLQELYASYNAQPLSERVKRKMLMEEIELVTKDLESTEQKLDQLLVRSPARGKFILLDARNLPGRFVKQGELLGYIVSEHGLTIRAVVSQADIGLIRDRITGVQISMAECLARPLKADIARIVPAADLNLPSAALGTSGGGIIPVDPNDQDGLRALESHFQLDLSLPEEVTDPHIGGRVYVRFEHGSMPLAMQLYRGFRQLFLRKFYV